MRQWQRTQHKMRAAARDRASRCVSSCAPNVLLECVCASRGMSVKCCACVAVRRVKTPLETGFETWLYSLNFPANCSRVARVLGLRLPTMSQQRRRSQLSKLITTLECESTDGTLRVAAFVNATDLEFEGSDAWRAGIDVDAWLTEGRDRAEIRDHRLTEQAAAYNPTAVAVRGYAAHCRTLAGSVTHAGYPSLAEAGWQQPRRELWKCWRSGDEDTLADDEVRLLAQALADPLCPFFLCAFSMSCRACAHAQHVGSAHMLRCYPCRLGLG